MHIDDRLATVLRHRTDNERAARTQYRQLLDLLNRQWVNADDQQETGWRRLLDLSEQLRASDRAQILQHGNWRLRDLSLILFLAEQEVEVASSALLKADLSTEQWLLLIPELPVRARGLLRLRRDLPEQVQELLERLGIRDRGLPRPDEADPSSPGQSDSEPFLLKEEMPASAHEEALVRPAAPPDCDKQAAASRATPAAGSGDKEVGATDISAVLRKITAFQEGQRKGAGKRPGSAQSQAEPQKADTERPVATVFDFKADTAGTIIWASADVAPSIIGFSLLRMFPTELLPEVNSPVYRLQHHLPVRCANVTLEGAPAITGDWVLDAVPQFASESGVFTGHIGRFRRPPEPQAEKVDKVAEEADRLRLLLHELRTPVNAIQGYAELIQQQMVGPVPHAYRARAASITSDAATILSGFADLEELARLESGAAAPSAGRTELSDALAATVRQLRPLLQKRGTGMDLIIQAARSTVSLDRSEADNLLWRLLAALTVGVGEQERLDVMLEKRGRKLELSCNLPLAYRTVDNLFAADLPVLSNDISPALFGPSFALRLVLAQAKAIGGSLTREEEKLLLTLPLATDE